MSNGGDQVLGLAPATLEHKARTALLQVLGHVRHKVQCGRVTARGKGNARHLVLGNDVSVLVTHQRQTLAGHGQGDVGARVLHVRLVRDALQHLLVHAPLLGRLQTGCFAHPVDAFPVESDAWMER